MRLSAPPGPAIAKGRDRTRTRTEGNSAAEENEEIRNRNSMRTQGNGSAKPKKRERPTWGARVAQAWLRRLRTGLRAIWTLLLLLLLLSLHNEVVPDEQLLSLRRWGPFIRMTAVHQWLGKFLSLISHTPTSPPCLASRPSCAGLGFCSLESPPRNERAHGEREREGERIYIGVRTEAIK